MAGFKHLNWLFLPFELHCIRRATIAYRDIILQDLFCFPSVPHCDGVTRYSIHLFHQLSYRTTLVSGRFGWRYLDTN